MAELTINQDEDTDLTLTPIVSPMVGSVVYWVMLARDTKSTVIENSQWITTAVTSITVSILSSDTANCSGAYYYELWEHRPSGTPQRMLDSGSVIITPTYAGDVTE
jgi:hypothetical protein